MQLTHYPLAVTEILKSVVKSVVVRSLMGGVVWVDVTKNERNTKRTLLARD